MHIPDAVWSESVKHGYVTNDDLNKLENINNHSLNLSEVDNFIKNNSLDYLDYGERECLYLCRNKQILHILTDDLAVRDAAKRLNIVPVGSLGIVVKAYRLGMISLLEAENRLNDLYEISSLFVTRAIVDLAIEHLKTQPD